MSNHPNHAMSLELYAYCTILQNHKNTAGNKCKQHRLRMEQALDKIPRENATSRAGAIPKNI